MPLVAGTLLGPYEILAPLGAGGMGEVYRARDSRLRREVAIKVLPEATAQDSDLLARFEREARMVAALSHPNLIALFDVGAERGVTYAVTELLEGSTLRDRLAAGALPLAEAMAIALQIVRGLCAAHAKDIVHRDLKPENIFVTNDAHVKILDFGLAKQNPAARDAAGAGADSMATVPGAVLGTIGYMPPAQLLGQPADARSDVFAFGAVFYEMLSGRRAFAGATWAETAAVILNGKTPELESAGRDLPRVLEVIVGRCLEKDPSARFSTALELYEALSATEASPGASAPPAPAPRPGIAMLAFENLTGDNALDWVGRGLPELLGTALARSQELDVYDPQRLANLLEDGGQVPGASAAVFAKLREHRVGRAILGSLLKSGGGILIQCRVVDVETGRVLHGDASRGSAADDVFDLAGALIQKLQTWLEIDLAGASAGDRWIREITTSSVDAYRLYLRGHEAMMASRWREAVGYHEHSISLDGEFLAARLDLAGCFWNLGDEARVEEHLAEARRLRSRASPREMLQIELIDAVISGDPQALIRTASSLRELYPESRFFTYLLGRGYYTAERWERCLETLEPLVRERWSWGWTYVLSARANEKLGRHDEALRCFERGMEVTHHNPELAFEYARSLRERGRLPEARDILLEASRSPALAETPEYEAQIRLELARIQPVIDAG